MGTFAHGLFAFVALTLVLGGAAAFLSGRALARHWRAPANVLLAAVPLAVAVRFLHAVLADEAADVAKGAMTFGLMIAFAYAGFAIKRRAQMMQQYSWLATRGGSVAKD